MTAQPDPSREAFEIFLIWLSSDREQALKKYDEIMHKMRKYFIRKGCPEHEELADETRDRVIKIVSTSPEYSNPNALFYSVGRKVLLEYLRKPKPEPLPDDDVLPVPQQDDEDKELRAHCLDLCLNRLPEAERDLIARYYQARGNNDEARRRLIAEHGGESTLRVKAFRIRTKLRTCISSCMAESRKLMIRGARR